MDVLDLLSSEEVCSRLFRSVRWRNGVYCPRCGSWRVKGHGNYGQGLKRHKCKVCGRTFNDKTGTRLYYSRLSLREWFTLMLLFLALHNSALGLSWLLDRSYMPVFKALKKIMLSLRAIQPKGMGGVVESDEVYVTAGLKGRNNSHRIKRLGRKPRRRGPQEAWTRNMGSGQASHIRAGGERGGGEDYVPSSDVKEETALKVIERRVPKGSKVYTDSFKVYLGLKEAGYAREAVNHSAGEYVRGEVHINGCENRASLLRPWLSIHRGICKDNLSLYLAAFRTCRRSRRVKPVEAITEILKAILIFLSLLAILRRSPALKPSSKRPSHNILS